jgi:serine/threonine-protein kinase
MLLARRYRIISKLGKGGMGEVFRADDLILGQQVALKFLPATASDNPGLLARFYDEVRIARQISHKNVCRVYDIGEVDGQSYLSMEYIDGEDLGSLLRRIGRLPQDKATEFARKLCAGLGAAHAQGVLHRDIKPGNIMIDSRGELRITDFGLAALADSLQGAEIRNGTPAYMAPEQLTGREVSVQSDIYAIGLVLYEMYTGKLPHQAETVAEVARLRQESHVTNPSTLVEMDKTVERVILRCLEADPKLRPTSALALAASLPGGDALAAALADGETPSPEAVAAAGSNEGLKPKLAMAALAAFAIAIIAFCTIGPRLYLINLLAFENPPEVLTAKARDIIRNLGYTAKPADSASGFIANGAYFAFIGSKMKNVEQWRNTFLQPPSALGYWYRQSPRALMADDNSSQVSMENPIATTTPGMVTVLMDPEGRLWRFEATPSDRVPTAEQAKAPPIDWAPLFGAAGLDPSTLTPAQPEWSAQVATDVRAAWTGPYVNQPELQVRIEAGALHGKPVLFRIYWPWIRATRNAAAPAGYSAMIQTSLVLLVLAAAVGVARYNWKAGRADPRSAVRIGLYCAVMSLAASLINAHHVASTDETDLLAQAMSSAAFTFGLFWVIYLALEPWVRRYWPQTMITWSRLLAGRWRDPLVGRDVLFGIICGVLYGLLIQGAAGLSVSLGNPPFSEFNIGNLIGVRMAAGNMARMLASALTGGLQLFLMFFLARIILRKQWLAAVVFVALIVTNQLLPNLNAQAPLTMLVTRGTLYTLIYGILVLIMMRLGFFAFIVTLFTVNSLVGLFLSTDFASWQGQSSLLVVGVLTTLAVWGFNTSLAGQPLFAKAALEK